jgi:hypothetical protein
MAKTKRAGTVTRTSATPPTSSGVPAAAPPRPIEADEAATARIKKTDPHRVGIDHVPVLQAHLSASRARAMHKAATGKLPAAKPPAKTAPKAGTKAGPKFGSPAWRAKYGKKKSAAAKPAAVTET